MDADPSTAPAASRGPSNGRLCGDPRVSLGPLRRPVAAYRASAPPWLTGSASNGGEQALLAELKQRFNGAVVANVPVYLPEVATGYVLDFLLPEFSVGIMVNRAATADEDRPEMHEHLRIEGIAVLSYDEEWVRQHPDEVVREIRYELGLADPSADAG